jgi:hypothetical protein
MCSSFGNEEETSVKAGKDTTLLAFRFGEDYVVVHIVM